MTERDPDRVGPRLFFQRKPEVKAVKNRLHLDVRVGVGLSGDKRVAGLETEAALVTTVALQLRNPDAEKRRTRLRLPFICGTVTPLG